eukprot:jgi/Chrzof1/11542/UNPLg00478.t1
MRMLPALLSPVYGVWWLLLGMPHPTSENLPSKIYISPPISLRFHPPSRPPVRAPSAHTNSGDMPLGLPVVCVTL